MKEALVLTVQHGFTVLTSKLQKSMRFCQLLLKNQKLTRATYSPKMSIRGYCG